MEQQLCITIWTLPKHLQKKQVKRNDVIHRGNERLWGHLVAADYLDTFIAHAQK